MRTILLSGIALAALAGAGPVWAADVRVPVLKAPVAVRAYSWTGFYLGGNVGVSAGYDPLTQTSQQPPFPISVNNQSSHDPFGGFGGAQAGYNYQSGNSVLGIEGDFQLSGQRSDQSCLTFCDFNFQNPSNIQFDGVSQRIPWFATLRARSGYAAGPALFYVTGGVAFAKIETTYSTNQFAAFSGTASDVSVCPESS